jgi:hypothetical protein
MPLSLDADLERDSYRLFCAVNGILYFYILEYCLLVELNREVVVVIVNTPQTGRWRNRSSIPGKGKKHLSSPKITDRLWCPSCLPFNEYCCCFSLGHSGCGVKLTTRLFRGYDWVELYCHFTHCATATGLAIRGSNPDGVQIFRDPPDRPRGPPSLLRNEYWVSLPEVKRLGRGVVRPSLSST